MYSTVPTHPISMAQAVYTLSTVGQGARETRRTDRGEL